MSTLRVGLIIEPAGWHLSRIMGACARHPEVGQVAIADPTGETFGRFHPRTGSSTDPHWRAGAHEPNSGPPPGWTPQGSAIDTPALLGDQLASTYGDHRRMLAEFKPDIVMMSLEPGKMPPLIVDCLEAGTHVYHEKPGCAQVEDYYPVVEASRRTSKMVFMALAMRGYPNIRQARDVVARGDLGALFAVMTHYVADHTRTWLWRELADGWFFDRTRGGGGHLTILGCHYLDMLRYVTGQDFAEVSGHVDTLGGEDMPAEDVYTLSFRFESGALGSMTGGYFLESGKQEEMTLWGRQGWLRFDPEAATYLEWFSRSGDGRAAPQRRLTYQPHDLWEGVQQFEHEVFRCCLGNGPPPITVEDGLWMLEAAFAAYRAASSGRTERIALGV